MRFVLLIILFCLFFGIAPNALAASEFIESHKTVYSVNSSGSTEVSDTITLTNKLSNVYADKYFLSVGFTNLTNVKVTGSNGLIPAVVTPTKNQTTISIEFVNKVVQKDKSNVFVVSYETPDIASKNGAVWEINIPRLEIQNDMGNYDVILNVPSDFGLAAFITPEPVSKTAYTPTLNVSNSYEFLMELNGNKSISAVFGTTQYMNFNLRYYLENIDPIAKEMSITLPPDTNYQTVWLKNIDPTPKNVTTDVDGNWLAIYKMNANEQINITATGIVKMSFLPTPLKLSTEELSRYTQASDLWNIKSSRIADLASNLRTPRSIYQYVVDHLSYDYSKLNGNNTRLGADSVLDWPTSAICTDYSDLFVALSRAQGIPARELEGFAFTSNDKLRPVSLSKDILHSWPEYYDTSKQSWVYVDPTWESTTGGIDYFNKIDLNHFVFAIHGISSYQPLPAGAFKKEGTPSKDVNVTATNAEVFPSPNIEIIVNEAVLTMKNTGQVAVRGDLLVSSSPTAIIDYKTFVETLPPMGEVDITLPIDKNKLNGTQKISLEVSFDERIYPLSTTLGATNKTLVMAGIAGGSLILGFTLVKAGGLLFRGRK